MTEKRKRDGVRSAQSSTKVLRRMLSAAAVLFVLCLVFMAPASAELTGSGIETDPYVASNLDELKAAFSNGGYVELGSSFTVSDSSEKPVQVFNGKPVVLDLAGYTITVTESSDALYCFITINAGAEFTLNDPSGNGKIILEATQNRAFNQRSAVISVEQATATINGGTIQHLGGTDMAYGIDVLTNGEDTRAKLVVNGGSIESNYRAVRLFLNGDGNALCALEVTGGSISGTNNAGVWIQNANANANPYSATITGGSISGGKNGAIMVSGNSATSLPGTLTINGGTLTSSSPEGTVKLSKMNNVESGFTLNIGSAAVIENTGEGTAIFGAAKNALSGTGTADDPYIIDSKTALQMFRDSVNAGNTYAGKTVKLTTDIDLNNEEWTPISTFNGIFDGGDHTIKNLLINGEGENQQGFFGNTYDGHIKNLNFENAEVTGRSNVGVVAGNPYTSKYTNITVTGHVEVNGMFYVGGVGGKNAYADWTNITVDVDASSYVQANSVENGVAYRTYVGGVIGFMGEGGHTFKNIYSNIKVIGSTIDVGGIAGIAHYGNNFENVVCEAPSIEITNAGEEADAREIGGIAGVWHNQKGQTVTFKDCVVGENTVLTSQIVDSDNNVVSTLSSENGDFGNILSAASYNKDTQGILKVQETDENGNVVSTKVYQKDENGVEKSAVYSGDVTFSSDGTTIISPDSSEPATPSVVLYEIDSAADLFAFAEAVNGGKTYAGETITLTADIDLKNEIWVPIGASGDSKKKFTGTFDGNDKTIYNLNVDTSAIVPQYSGTDAAAGLFGATTGTIKNLTIDGAYVEHVSSGSATVNGIAVLAGSTAYGATIENITVKNAVVKGNRYVAGIVGYADGTIKNCHVENVTLIATPNKLDSTTADGKPIYDNGDKVGGIVGYTNSDFKAISDCSAKDIEITAYRDAGGILGCLNVNIEVTGSTVSGTTITINQDIGDAQYDDGSAKAPNAGAVSGRYGSESYKDNIDEESTTVTETRVITIDSNGEITVDLGFSYEIDTVYLTGDSTSGYSVLENSVIHLPLNYSVTAESSPADVWYVNVTVTDENEAPVQVAHSLSSSVIDASYFQYHEDKKVYQVSNNDLVGVDKDTPALFKLDLETAALDAGKKYNVTIEITTVATTDIVGEASLYSYDAVSELEIQIGIDAWVISVDHNLYNTKEDGTAVTNPWGLENRANIVYKVKNPYNGKDTTYFSNEDNTIVKRNADAPYGLNLSGSVKQTIVKIVGGDEIAVAAGTKITAENGKLVMTVADADLDADSFKITFDGQKAGDLSNIKAFPDTIDVIDANYILKESAATGNYIPADFKVFADVTKDANIDTDDATLVFFFGLNKLADEQKTSVELEYPTA